MYSRFDTMNSCIFVLKQRSGDNKYLPAIVEDGKCISAFNSDDLFRVLRKC